VRAESARKARERASAQPESAAFEVVERGDRQRRVALAVMQLAEPYRSTILYRYLDDLSTHAVAERMGVPEATVRKRIERGLTLLRERLEREFGSRSSTWALALLDPRVGDALAEGMGLMSIKWIAAAGVCALVGGAAWYARGDVEPNAPVAVGEFDTPITAAIAAADVEQPSPVRSTLADPVEAPRAIAAPSPIEKPSGLVRIHGSIFVDGERLAPLDLALEIEPVYDTLTFDARAANWSLPDASGEPLQLWITSSSTVPVQLDVPPDLCARGGVLDLQLSSGRTLVLTFLDRETKAPLPNLEFQLSNQIELERSRGRVTFRGHETLRKTDAEGKATIEGAALAGSVAVRIDLQRYERKGLMKNGQAFLMASPSTPVWDAWFKPDSPKRIEQTILASIPLGEAVARGEIPAWAGALSELHVVVQERTGGARRYGDPFLLEHDERGGFELRAPAPSEYAVWLEHTGDRRRISDETKVVLQSPGVQDPITFRELSGSKVTLRCFNVPARGVLQALMSSASGSARSESRTCSGAPFELELTVARGEQLQLSLRLAATQEKSGWMRRIVFDGQRTIDVDLGGSERVLRCECPELGVPLGNGALMLFRCESGEASVDTSILALCSKGLAASPVLVPSGRWLYRYDDPNQPAMWGVVDVYPAHLPGEELLLRPRVRWAAPEEFPAGTRFDEIDGVSLAQVPDKLRRLIVDTPGARIAVPIDAKYSTIEEKQ
jgi:hypothetical protein